MEKFNIYKRRDGRWEGRISKGKKENGKRKFQYVFARTKENAIEKIIEIKRREYPEIQCSKIFSLVYEEWHRSIRHQVKESTISNYVMKAKKHLLPEFGNKLIDSISQNEIYNFIEYKGKEGLSDRYISDIIVLMKSIFKYAVKVYHVFNPLDGITMSKKKSSKIELLDEKEQEKLQQYIAKNPNNTNLGVALSMSTGIRIGELCALQWEDIDLEKRILTVKKTIQRIQCPTDISKTKLIITEPKSETSKRSIPVPDCIINFLQRFKGKDKEYVLSGSEKPIEPRTMQYRFAKILKNVNLPSVHFHALRHIFASTCVKLGFDVKTLSELLGHSSVEITLNLYVHSSFEQKRKYMKLLQLNF